MLGSKKQKQKSTNVIVPHPPPLSQKSLWLYHLETTTVALVGVAQWIEPWPVNQRVTGWIPSQGTCLGCRPGPQWQGVVHARQPHIDLSLPFFLPPFLSL